MTLLIRFLQNRSFASLCVYQVASVNPVSTKTKTEDVSDPANAAPVETKSSDNEDPRPSRHAPSNRTVPVVQLFRVAFANQQSSFARIMNPRAHAFCVQNARNETNSIFFLFVHFSTSIIYQSQAFIFKP